MTRHRAPESPVELVHATSRRVRLRLPQNLLTGSWRAAIVTVLGSQPNVLHHRFNSSCRSLIIEHDGTLSSKQVCKLVDTAEPGSPSPSSESSAGASDGKWIVLGIGGLLALAGSPLATPILLASALPIFRRGFSSLFRARKLNVDVLDSVALMLTLAGGHMVTAAAVTGMIEGGEWLRDATASRSRRAIGELIADRNATVMKVVGTKRVAIRIAELQPDDVVALAPGDHIPVDGVVRSGTATVDQRFLTGEPLPAQRSEGDCV